MSNIKAVDLKSVDAFRFLKDRELSDLLTMGEIFECVEGDMITEEDEISPEVYFIVNGMVNVYVRKNNQKEAYISLIGEGEAFGEAGIFPNLKRTAKIAAAGTTLIYKISRKNLLQFISKHTSAGIKILMLIIYGLLRKLRGLNQELAFERQDDADQSAIDSLVEEFLEDL